MLGTLAKWLRIYGFDTSYAGPEMDDEQVLNRSKKEDRILLTRDKDLINSAKRENIKNIQIKSTILDEQIKTTLNKKNIDIEKILSRCILCNSLVQDIKKEDVKEQVPERIFKSTDRFWVCPKCKKVYWKGSHYENMIEKIKNLG
jgi:uncharacterized protein with PIN domain